VTALTTDQLDALTPALVAAIETADVPG